jgi:hypothetical protein
MKDVKIVENILITGLVIKMALLLEVLLFLYVLIVGMEIIEGDKNENI